MQTFSIRTTLTLTDWRALQRASALKMQQGAQVRPWRVMALWFAIAFASFAIVDVLDVKLNLLSLMFGVVLVVAVVMVAHNRNLIAARPRDGGPHLSPSELELSPEGITSIQSGARSFSQWQRVMDVTATAEHVFIWLEAFSAYVIPVRDLPDGLTAEQLVASCKEWMAAPAAAEPASFSLSIDAPEESQPEPAPVAPFEPSWRVVLRLLTLRAVERPGAALSANLAGIVSLAALSLAAWVGLSWFYYLPEPSFYPYSLPALAWYVLALLAVAAAMAGRSHPQIAMSRVCMLLAILMPILIIGDFVTVMFVPELWTAVADVVLAFYAIVYCSRGLHALTGQRQPVAIMGGALIALSSLWLASVLYIDPAPWTPKAEHEHADSEPEQNAGDEALLFEQPARIDASIAKLQPPTDAAPAGFFVGFAGYGEQRVFAEEIKFAAQTFAKRYDTADRTLLLLNDKRDRQAEPLATVSGLRYALKGVAAKMRLEQDVLFLALSSHGSKDPLLSVLNGALPLQDLSGSALAEALHASGIKWRVIVISACHAGAFIEPLRDPYTAIITAAAPERTSFGCSDDRDLTYFGEAFFRDSLPQATSLRDAFDTANKLVSERERSEGFEPSQPQAFFGEAIEQQIAPLLRPAAE